MTSSSEQRELRGLDAMVIIYSLLEQHPVSDTCEAYIRSHDNWLTTTLTLLEAKAILLKVYDVNPNLAAQQLTRFSAGPIEIIDLDLTLTLNAMQIAEELKIDITDAVLLQAMRVHNVNILATDDRKLIRACNQINITVENPIDASLRRQMADWELTNLPQKGLPCILRQIHGWLHKNHQQVAEDFWHHTGGGSHLP